MTPIPDITEQPDGSFKVEAPKFYSVSFYRGIVLLTEVREALEVKEDSEGYYYELEWEDDDGYHRHNRTGLYLGRDAAWDYALDRLTRYAEELREQTITNTKLVDAVAAAKAAGVESVKVTL
jgi:hypothetical protein